MNLVLVGRHSLDEMQAIVEEQFAQIEDKNIPHHNFENEVVFNREHSFGRIFKIIPQKNMKSLVLKWLIPVNKPYSKKKTASYLSHVIGHEGPNSLLSCLIDQSLASSLSAGSNNRLNAAVD